MHEVEAEVLNFSNMGFSSIAKLILMHLTRQVISGNLDGQPNAASYSMTVRVIKLVAVSLMCTYTVRQKIYIISMPSTKAACYTFYAMVEIVFDSLSF